MARRRSARRAGAFAPEHVPPPFGRQPAPGSRVSVGGSGIPRLQDLSYIEVAAGQVAAGATFEQVRRSLVTRAAELARDSDTDGSFDQRRWDQVRADGTKHVHNTVDVLKELMRVGWLDKHILPSTPNS